MYVCAWFIYVYVLYIYLVVSHPLVTHITNVKHRAGTWVYPAGNPVNTRCPDGLMSYGPFPTPDTPFTDHSGEPHNPPGHFIFRFT